MTHRLAIVSLALVLASCTLGENYSRPPLDVPAAFKSAATTQPAEEATHLITNWWLLFGDSDLTTLEDAALQNNPDLQAAVARVAEARAAAAQVKSRYYPQVSFDPSVTATFSARGKFASPTQIPLDLGYEVDIWGQVARSLESADAATRASADQFAVVMQTLESDVAMDYMNLRSLENQDDIFTENVKLTEEQLDLANQKLKAGLVGKIDIAQAQTQLDELYAQQIDIRRQRADAEHALAILTGKPPAEFSLATKPAHIVVPDIPPGLPSDLLRHRPDVAAAEENLIGANADVGVAITNFYPTLTLTGLAGFESVDVQHALDWQNAILSIGPSISLPIFEGGKLSAALAQARARYQELLATYRSTLLTAFSDVEISLTDVHKRTEALDAQHRAVVSARESLRLSQLEYDQGLIAYFQLLDADETLLADLLTEAQLLNDRLDSTVLLIKALGGGWNPDAPTSRPAPTPVDLMPVPTMPAQTAPVETRPAQATTTQ